MSINNKPPISPALRAVASASSCECAPKARNSERMWFLTVVCERFSSEPISLVLFPSARSLYSSSWRGVSSGSFFCWSVSAEGVAMVGAALLWVLACSISSLASSASGRCLLAFSKAKAVLGASPSAKERRDIEEAAHHQVHHEVRAAADNT